MLLSKNQGKKKLNLTNFWKTQLHFIQWTLTNTPFQAKQTKWLSTPTFYTLAQTRVVVWSLNLNKHTHKSKTMWQKVQLLSIDFKDSKMTFLHLTHFAPPPQKNHMLAKILGSQNSNEGSHYIILLKANFIN